MFVTVKLLMAVLAFDTLVAATGMPNAEEAGTVENVDHEANNYTFAAIKARNNMAKRVEVVTVTVTETNCDVQPSSSDVIVPPPGTKPAEETAPVPTKPVESVKPTESAMPSKSTKPVEPSKSAVPTKPTVAPTLVPSSGAAPTSFETHSTSDEEPASTTEMSIASTESASITETESADMAPTKSATPAPSAMAAHNAGMGPAMLAGVVGFAALVAL